VADRILTRIGDASINIAAINAPEGKHGQSRSPGLRPRMPAIR
jgi:hypothetical protein